jgi:ribosome-binding factor A
MKKAQPSERSQRQLRVAEQIKHVLIDALKRNKFHDEALLEANLFSVAEVRISPDLKNATAYTTSLKGEEHVQQSLKALNRASGYFQKEIAHQLSLKFTPHVKFISDSSVGTVNRIEELLRKIHEEEK